MHSEPVHSFCLRCGVQLEPRRIGDLDRLACPAEGCEYVFWDNPVPVVAAIVEHENGVVLANNKAWPDHWFSLITGFLEKNEEPAAAAVREVREELGLDSKIGSLVGVYGFAKMNQVIIAYHVIAQGEIRLGEELRAWKKIDKDKLKPWDTATGHAVRDWLEQQKT